MFSKTILSALLLLLSPLAFAQDDCDTEIEEIGVECPDALGSLVRCLLKVFFRSSQQQQKLRNKFAAIKQPG